MYYCRTADLLNILIQNYYPLRINFRRDKILRKFAQRRWNARKYRNYKYRNYAQRAGAQKLIRTKIFDFLFQGSRDVEMREILYRNYAQRAGARKLIRAKIFDYSFLHSSLFNKISPLYFLLLFHVHWSLGSRSS